MARTRGGMIGEFIAGAAYPLRGVAFLAGRPTLWPLAILPFALSFLIYGGAMWLGVKYGRVWVDSLIAGEGMGWHAVEILVDVILFLVLLFVVAVTFIPIATLVANPFCDLLSEHVEKIHLGRVDDTAGFSIGKLFANLGGEVKRSATLMIMLLGAWMLNFIPVAGNALAAGVTAYVTIAFLSLEYTSFAMDRRDYPWRRRREYLREHRARTLGFGAVAFAVMLVPVVNALFVPAAAVAGTMLFCDTALRADAPGNRKETTARD